MVEVHIMYNLIPNANKEAYGEWMKKSIVPLLKSQGIIQVRALRNKLGSPHVLIIIEWESLSDWARFAETNEWNNIQKELENLFASDMKISIWTSSTLVPDIIRPPKK